MNDTHPPPAAPEQRLRSDLVPLRNFIGSDARDAETIIRDDARTLEQLGLTSRQMASRLRELRTLAASSLGRTATDDELEVTLDEARGTLPCPFAHPGQYPKINTTVRSTRTGRTVTFSDLGLHLIEAHGFYQGQGSPYRLDPRDLAELLGLAGADRLA